MALSDQAYSGDNSIFKRGKPSNSSRPVSFTHLDVYKRQFVLVAVSMLVPNAALLSLVLLLYGFLGKMAVDPVLISHVSDNADPKNVATTLGVFNFFGMSSSCLLYTSRCV